MLVGQDSSWPERPALSKTSREPLLNALHDSAFVVHIYWEVQLYHMSNSAIPLNHNALSDLLNDPIILRILNVINLASLSILELLEFGFTRRDISRALAKGVIEFDKQLMPSAPENMSKTEVIQHVLETGDYYFGFLSNEVRLTKLGLYMLEIMEAESVRSNGEEGLPKEEVENLYGRSVPHL